MSRSRASSVAAVSAVLLWTLPARAQISAWLDFDGAIQGEATDERHRDWIDILGFDIASTVGISTVAGGDRETSVARVSELGLSKFVDRATPGLFRAIVEGREPFAKATLDLTTGDGTAFARLELENVLVSGQSFQAAAGQDRPTESITLNFAKITYIYILPDGDELFAKYDIEKNLAESGTRPGGSDPDADSDGDGMPDSWESANGLNVGGDDSGLDADGDGLTNRQEFELGTNPRSGTSFFKATLVPQVETPGSYQITWNSVPGKTYVIEWSPDLVTRFSALRTVVATSASTTETVTPAGAVGFYRVRPQ